MTPKSHQNLFIEQAIDIALQHHQSGLLADAERAYRQAIAIRPDYAALYVNLGNLLYELGRLEEARIAYCQAIGIAPDYAIAHCNLGNLLYVLGRNDEAVAAYRQALSFRPDYAEAHCNLGNMYYEIGRFEESAAAYSQAVMHKPFFAEAHSNLGNALRNLGRLGEAEEAFRHAIALKADYSEAYSNLGNVLRELCRLDEAETACRHAIALKHDFYMAHSNLLLTQQYAFSITHEETFRTALNFGTLCEEKFKGRRGSHQNVPDPGKRLKVGFVSGDLGNHPVGYFLETILQHINCESVELVAYANQSGLDALSERIRPCFETWISVKSLSDEKLASRIRDDGIDILVDLAGHTSDNRLVMFAYKPAPVQITWLGYPNTTGLHAIDYILADPITIPTAEEMFYTEKVWRLPESYACFTPPDTELEISQLPAQKNGYITFGCFNNPAKLNDTVVACWAEILKKVQNSVLLLKYKAFDYEKLREDFRQRFNNCGIDPERILFQGYSARNDYLAAYRNIDVALDSFPFPGFTTTCEALWMGVPTMSLMMPRGIVGHNGELIMRVTGLDEFVAESVDEYIDKAAGLVKDLERLALIRSESRGRLLRSPLCDPLQFARNLESALRGIWQQWCSQSGGDLTSCSGNNQVNDPATSFRQGVLCMEAGEYAAAESCFRRTLTLAPVSIETMLNLGYVLDLQERPEEALGCYESVLEFAPDNAKARYNRAGHLLRTGNFAAGFSDYEYRFFALKSADSRRYSQPRWDGSPLNGRSILVYCEQGLGDAIQFARYIPLLARQGGRVILEVQQPLVSLLSDIDGVEQVVIKTEIPPQLDVYIPLLSLPYIFKTTIDTIPNHTPYLMSSKQLVSIWKKRLQDSSGKVRIGLVWAGKPHPYPNRSCPPGYLEKLFSIPGLQFYSLQVGEQERFQLPRIFLDEMVDLTAMISNFADTAALIANLDLVITIDTAVAHLAGALGKQVWVMLSHAPDWRWMVGRNDSPWYPAMRLFRQPKAGDWDSVTDEVAQELMQLSHYTAKVKVVQESEENRFKSALQSLSDGNNSIAIEKLNGLLAQIQDDPAIWFNLGRAYDNTEQPVKAAECYKKALQLKPDSPAVLFCLGKICLNQNEFSEAEAYLRRAYEQMPQSIEILLQLGAALVRQNDISAAFECCNKMLAINPECLEAKYNLAYLQLRSGDYLAGFTNFEARLAMDEFKIDQRSYPQPRWDGSPLKGKSVLVFGEQGMGDVIQFARYLPLVAERGGKVILEVDPPLIPLFDSFPGVAIVIPKSVTPPLTDVYIHLLSLPHLFGTTLETVPQRIPYFTPDKAKSAEWQRILAGESACRIGLVWRGSPNNPIDRERSCSLSAFSALSTLTGVRFFSLQVGAGTDEIQSTDFGMALTDLTGRLKDLSDTAAFIANLDLVIGVDTAVTHLAGAMGKPVWIILPHVYDWRWLMGRDESPWYPTGRVFWQQRQGDWDGAIARLKDELEQQLVNNPGSHKSMDIESCYNLGVQLKETGDLAGAERCFSRIVDLDPGLPDPQHSLGVVLQLQDRPKEAIEHYRAAINTDPCFVKAHYNLANALLQCARYQEATASALTVIQYDPDHADAHWLLGMLSLQRGDFLNGWKEYEWRWKAKNFKTTIPDLGRPLWDGSPLNGRSLLIHMEQGRGDMIQFVRFASKVAAAGGKIIVCAVQELVPLLRSVEGVSQVVLQSGPLPDFDLHVPVLSLPFLLGTTLETIPCKVPYFWPDQNKIENWRQSLPFDGRLRVGLAWQGSVIHRDDRNRSCALARLQVLGNLTGVDFYSLQIGDGAGQLASLSGPMKIIDFTGRISDFSDTAAIILNLDLVISVDTAVAHLAGALGKPVWILLPFVPDWRWLLGREDSPWYPSMRLFRQESPDDWSSVINSVSQELSLLLDSGSLINQQGIDLMNSGRFVEAEIVFSRMIAGDPGSAEAYCNRGVALDAMNRYEDAIDCYRMALSLEPDNVQALFNMGNACVSLANPDGALACYERVLQLKPDFVPAHLCLGGLYKTRRDFGLSHICYRNTLSVDPSCLDALQGIAETYQAEEKFEKAIIAYEELLNKEPGRAGVWNLLGTVYHSLEMHDAAEGCYRRALELLPDCLSVLNNLGVELNDQGRIEEAVSVYRHLLEVDSGYAEGHWNLAVALLSTGNYLEGWQEYEWRFKKTNPVVTRNFSQPRWDGLPLNGRTILLHAEQGFGDTIQFVRYAVLMAKRGDRVIIECQVPALKRLLCSLEGVAGVFVAGEPLPHFDCHLPMMSLPLLFGTTLDTIPLNIPYIAADPADVDVWKQRLGPASALRVGLVWYAKQSQVLNRKRSCRLELFAPLWSVPGVEYFSLQIGLGAEQLAECGADSSIIDLTSHITDFADTAAFIANLDLVITIDTAVAHLAGALGARTWVLLPSVAEWRWLHNRQDSPWYPATRLFRQPVAGDWPGLMVSVAAALNDCVHARHKPIITAPSKSGLRVGLAWSGRQDNPLNRKRSCPFAMLAPLFDLPDITFFSLQIDSPDGENERLIDFTGQINGFEDTAALMANLDLIISIDTSVAHLAAASGRPTWVLLSHAADWRWLIGRDDSSLWYPGTRLFRQPDHGDWESVMREVSCRLAQFTASRLDWNSRNIATHPDCGQSNERQLLEQQLESHLDILRLNAGCPDAHLDVGVSMALLGRYDEAAASFRLVLELDNENVAAHLNLAYSLLALGDYSEGWQHLEWRLRRIPAGQLPPYPMLRHGQLGTDPKDTSVMVHCEQGFGDTIMFSRFLPLLADAGYQVVVSCQPPMASLIASIDGVSRVVLHGELLPRCDRQVLLLSLPYLFSTTIERLPTGIPYLRVSEQFKEAWKARIEKNMQQV